MGLGTMYFGSKVGEKTSFALLDFYAEKDGSFLDSANKYASWVSGFRGGESETVIGKWLKQRGNRQKMFLTSKVGFPYGEIPRSLKKEIIISECDRSLHRLNVETIDLYFAHAYDSETSAEEVMDAFLTLKEQGKIRFAGASNYYGWQLAEAENAATNIGFEGFTCLQQRHTYLEPGLRANFGTQILLSPEIEQYCQKKGISIMAYSPLLGGAYVDSGKAMPIQYQNAANDYRLEKLAEISEKLQKSPNAIILAWMLQNSPIIIPMVTGSSVSQLKENFEALSIELTKEQVENLNQDIVKPNKY